jgi:hypothetical protein
MLNALGRHFQGESCDTSNPGLKPWAVLCDHFVVKAHNQELQLWSVAASEF